jgi:hypothetical protein
MRSFVSLVLIISALWSTGAAQSEVLKPDAAKAVQPSESGRISLRKANEGPPQGSSTQPGAAKGATVPAGTPLDIESAATVNSSQVQPGELLSFRVLIPVKIDGLTVIEKDALVTGQVVEARRGGHWGRAGRLSWVMQDVIALDGSRIPVQAEQPVQPGAKGPGDTGVPGARRSTGQRPSAERIKGDSHAGEIAARSATMGALLVPILPVAPILAPLIIMHGFKRGGDAILPAHKRFVVFVSQETRVKVKS